MAHESKDAWLDADEDRQRLLVFCGLILTALLGVYLVSVDPVWRILHREGLLSLSDQESRWTQVDASTLRKLSQVSYTDTPGDEGLERELTQELSQRRLAARAPASASPVEVNDELGKLARTWSRLRTLEGGVEPEAPPLEDPTLALVLFHGDLLVATTQVFQELRSDQRATATAGELVGGWLNRAPFRRLLIDGDPLTLGVGAVETPEGGVMITVVLAETVASLDTPLPSVADEGKSLILRFRGFENEAVELFWKPPQDPGFSPLTSSGPSYELRWQHGKGSYLLRARRGDRLSDPRPILVE